MLKILSAEVTGKESFCKWCDLNENIIKWGSEEFFIPYLSPVDKRVHRYFPDFIIQVKESTGRVKTYVIEVKPKQTTTKKPTSKSSLFERQKPML